MLDVRTAMGFSLSCQIIRFGPHVVILPAEQTHLEGVVSRGSLGDCGRHYERMSVIQTESLKERKEIQKGGCYGVEMDLAAGAAGGIISLLGGALQRR